MIYRIQFIMLRILTLVGLLLLQTIASRAQNGVVNFTIRTDLPAQIIDNFGGSGCWFSEGIGLSWPGTAKDSIARLLFSKELDHEGRPLGIGLSAWRFNI